MTTRSYDISVDKHVDDISSLNVVLVADLHLGYSIGCSDMEKMVDRINALNPDVVIYAGDILIMIMMLLMILKDLWRL